MAGLNDRRMSNVPFSTLTPLTMFCTAPVYLSPRSADVVLSEIRPTKLAPDALRSVNVLLDELMWMILSTARSFATDQIKSALGKLLPTILGKEALLEAEVELHAYWDRTTDHPSRPYAENTQDFPIQPAFEVCFFSCLFQESNANNWPMGSFYDSNARRTRPSTTRMKMKRRRSGGKARSQQLQASHPTTRNSLRLPLYI